MSSFEIRKMHPGPRKDSKDSKKLLVLAYATGILAALTIFSLNVQTYRFQKIFSADFLTPFLIARDFLLSIGSVQFWTLPEAPYFFPDIFVAIVSSSLFANLNDAVLVVMFGHACLLITTQLLVVDQVGGENRVASMYFFLFLSLATHICIFTYEQISYEVLYGFIIRQYVHAWTVPIGLVSGILIVAYLKRPRMGIVFALFSITAVSVYSDHLMLAHQVAPIIASNLLITLFYRAEWRRLSLLSLVVGTAAAISFLFSKLYLSTTPAVFFSAHKSYHVLTESAQLLLTSFMTSPISTCFLIVPWLCSLGHFFRIVFRHLAKSSNRPAPGIAEAFWSAFLTFSLLFGICAILVAGRFYGYPTLRYFQIHALGLLGMTLAAQRSQSAKFFVKKCKEIYPHFYVVFSISALGIASMLLGPALKVREYFPPSARCSQEILQMQTPIKVLANYWPAKTITAYLKPNVVGITVARNGTFWPWAISLSDASGLLEVSTDSGPKVGAVLLDKLSRHEIAGRFGPPSTRRFCEGYEFWLYDDRALMTQRFLSGVESPVSEALAAGHAIYIPSWFWTEASTSSIQFRYEWKAIVILKASKTRGFFMVEQKADDAARVSIVATSGDTVLSGHSILDLASLSADRPIRVELTMRKQTGEPSTILLSQNKRKPLNSF